MRFMMLVKASKESEAGMLPSKELIAAMGQFNEEMAKAGVVLAGEGLQATRPRCSPRRTRRGSRSFAMSCSGRPPSNS